MADFPSRRRALAVAAGGALAAGLFVPAFAPARAFAQAPAPIPAARLSQTDQDDVKRVEDYLNTLRTFRARFIQIDPYGGEAKGLFYLSRPGKLRLDYDAPNPNLLISNGQFLIHYDRELKAPSYLPINSTPAGLLVRDPVSLKGDLAVAKVERGPAVLRVTAVQTADPRAGAVTFVFSERPFALTNWQVVDSQGAMTRIALYEAQAGQPLDPQLFVFRDPTMYGDNANDLPGRK